MGFAMDRKLMKHLFSYLFWGVATTAVNVGTYQVCRVYGAIGVTLSTSLAWVVSVLFAFFTNRRYVFVGHQGTIPLQLVKFFGSRLFSGIVDVLLMALLVTLLHLPEILSKIGVNVVVVIMNYFLSRIYVFKMKEGKDA